jgi:hypothetical protein
MNRQSRAVLEKLERLNSLAIVQATRRIRDNLPGVRCKGHEPRSQPNSSPPSTKVHKGELVPVSWKKR